MKPITQVALDLIDLEDALRIGKQAVKGGIDWVEAGTPLIKSEGISSVKKLNQEFPDKKIVADMKTIDTGELEVKIAGQAGADIVSVFGASADETIKEAVDASSEYEVNIIADLITIEEPSERVRELTELGVDYIGIHAGIDQQEVGTDPLKQLSSVINSTSIPIGVAGGLNSETAPKAVKAGASIIIVGSAITTADNPTEASEKIVKSVRGAKNE